MQTIKDFAVGDTVRHPNGAVGRVIKFGPEGACSETCVHVEFGPVPDKRIRPRKWHGAYPNSWLRQYRLEPVGT